MTDHSQADALVFSGATSLDKHGGIDEAAFARLLSLLRYVDGDYRDQATFARLRDALGAARRPLH